MSKQYYKVTYDKKIGGTGTMIVRAYSENNALTKAKGNCHTGTNFRDPKVTNNPKPWKTVFVNKWR